MQQSHFQQHIHCRHLRVSLKQGSRQTSPEEEAKEVVEPVLRGFDVLVLGGL